MNADNGFVSYRRSSVFICGQPSFQQPELYDEARVCDNCRPMKPTILVTKRIYPEAIEYLEQHAELEYVESDDGMTPEDLLARIRGKVGVVSQLTDQFSAAVLDQLDGIRV